MNIDNGPLLSDYEGFFMAIDSVLLVVGFIHHRTFLFDVFVLMDFYNICIFITFVFLELMMDVNPKIFH